MPRNYTERPRGALLQPYIDWFFILFVQHRWETIPVRQMNGKTKAQERHLLLWL
jgi:hypothetical protein